MAIQVGDKKLDIWAGMLNADANINRRGAKRTVPMEVLSLGMHRTGTVSMREAYAILGYSEPYHFASIVFNVQDADMWNEALRAKYSGVGKPYGRAEFDQLLGHSAVVTDTPGCCLWEELVEAYPDAKVVLVERDEQKWLQSFSCLVDGVLNPFGQYVLRFTDPFWWGKILTCGRLWMGGMYGSLDREVVKRNAPGVYRKHYEDIRRTVPKERLLNYKLGSGWGPLCEFLGKEVPDVPFPHKNEAETLASAFETAILKSLKRSAVTLLAIVGAVFLAVRMLK